MALDPSISLAVRPPVIPPLQIQTPLEKFAKIQTLRNLMNQGQLGQMNIQQTQLENEALQRSAQEAQTLGSWMQQNQQRSQDITPQEIVAAHPNPTGIKFATALSAQQTAALTQHKAVLDAAHEEAKTDDRIYNSVIDDTSKMAALAELVRLKRIDSTMASHLTAIPFDSPEFKGIQQRATAQSLDRLQRIEAAKKEIDLRIAQTTESSVTQKAIDEATKAGQEVKGTQPITLQQKAQAEAQLWTEPGGLIAIINDPNSTPADKKRAQAGLQQHEGLKRAGATTMMITPNQNIANESKLRDDYYRDTKDYVSIRNAYNKIVGAAKSASAAGDIGLVYGFMRMQDPTSTVREGEFATAQNAGGIPERIRAMYNKAVNGERLDPVVRADFVTQAEKIHGQSYADYLKTKDMYSGIASRGGMDPRNVVIDYSTAKPAGQTQKPATHRYDPKTGKIEVIP